MPLCNSALTATPAAALLRPDWPRTTLQRESIRAARDGQWLCVVEKQRPQAPGSGQ